MRALFFLPLLLAATPAGFTPGQWQLTSAPTGASLNGRALSDLPYSGSAAPRTVCLTPDQARSTAWLTRDLAPGCTVTHSSLTGGKVEITGTCPPQAPGLARGTVRLTGRWTPTGYDLRFETANPSENGVMGFTGTMAGKRVGDCAP